MPTFKMILKIKGCDKVLAVSGPLGPGEIASQILKYKQETPTSIAVSLLNYQDEMIEERLEVVIEELEE